MIPRLQNGARTFLYINGSLVGLVTGFSFTSDTPAVEISGIDVDFPIELGPGRVNVSGTITMFKLITDSGAQSYGLTTPQIFANIQKYVSLTLVDRGIDTTLFQCDYAKITTESWQVATKSLMTGSLSFQGILWSSSQ